MKKINNQYKITALTPIFWHHLLQWLRLLVLALARSREWVPQAVFHHPDKPQQSIKETIFKYQNILK